MYCILCGYIRNEWVRVQCLIGLSSQVFACVCGISFWLWRFQHFLSPFDSVNVAPEPQGRNRPEKLREPLEASQSFLLHSYCTWRASCKDSNCCSRFCWRSSKLKPLTLPKWDCFGCQRRVNTSATKDRTEQEASSSSKYFVKACQHSQVEVFHSCMIHWNSLTSEINASKLPDLNLLLKALKVRVPSDQIWL